jgi:LPS-assembly protein
MTEAAPAAGEQERTIASYSFRFLLLAAVWALSLPVGAQQGLQLKTQPTLILVPPSSKEKDDLPLFIDADRLQGRQEGDIEAEGNVRLRKRGYSAQADWMRYEQPSQELNAEGNVRMEMGADVLEGARLRYNLGSERGEMDGTRYTLHQAPVVVGERQVFREADARGSAERLLFEGPNQYRAERTEYTTCSPGNEDWHVRARDLTIDRDRDVGVARDATIEFLGATIFYTPYLSFSLHQERKTGFLTPHYASSSTTGVELTVPFYINIAPNRDATIAPRIMTRRGVLVNGEFRYLEPTYRGETRAEVLPNDDARESDTRWAYLVRHVQALPDGWGGSLRAQRVSDDNYFTDLGTKISQTSTVQLPSDLNVGRVTAWGNAGSYSLDAVVQRWQTLQVDPLAPITPPYNRLPQISFAAAHQDVLRTEVDLIGQYSAFHHPTLVKGQRALAYPSLSVPLRVPYAYFTPKAGVTLTRYLVDENTTSGYASEDRTVPIFSADSGMTFERPTTLWGVPYLQTLEPRLYYLYIPFRDQSRIPVFDSAEQDVNFTTIYAENQFTGWDRINDANQITVGVSSRLLASDTGAQRLRVGVAQRYYFEPQRVTLPDVAPRSADTSDLLAALVGNVAQHWTVNTGVQYNTDLSQMQKFNIGTRYLPRAGQVLNLSYRETRDVLQQADISAQWPVGKGWTALARWNYSFLDHRTLEGLLGAEYNGDCWVLRLVAHRFVTTTQEASLSYFVQLELNGVSRIGHNPMSELRRNIGGYSQADPRALNPEDARPSPRY